MKNRNLLVPLTLVALSLSLSVVSVPSVAAATNLLYINPGAQPATGGTITYSVRVSNMVFNAWDIQVRTDPAALNPTSFSITPNTLTANFSIGELELTHCVNGVGTGCNPAAGDGAGVVHSAVFPLGASPAASASGILFTITYTGVANAFSTVVIFNDVIASNGLNVVHTTQNGAYGTVVLQDFTISATPASQSLAAPPGGFASYLVQLNSIGTFTGSVSLAADVSPPGQGVNATLDTNPVLLTTGTGSSNLKLGVASSATAGQYTITVTGSATIGGQPVSHAAAVTLTVTTTLPDYAIGINPDPLPAIPASYNGTSTVTVVSINGFAGTVSLSSTTSPTHVLGGPVGTFSSNTVTLSAGGSASVSLLVQTFPLTPVPAPSPSGEYALIIIGNSGSLTHSALAVVSVKPSVFFLHLRWDHKIFFSKSNIQDFTAVAQNNSTGTVLAQVVVKIRCGTFRTEIRSAVTSLPGGNVVQNVSGPLVTISFSIALPTSTVGTDCTVRGAMFYGGSATSTLQSVKIRRNTFHTNIVSPLIAVNGKTKTGPTKSLIFQFDTTLTGKFTVNP